MEHAGVSKPVAGIVVPTGYSFNLDGTAIYLTMATLFIAEAMDKPLALGEQIGLLLFMVIASKGAAGVTGAGLATLAGGLQSHRPELVDAMVLLGATAGIEDPDDLQDLHEIDRYTSRYADIAVLAGADPASVHGFLAEELLSGVEVTLEGYVHDGRVTTIGVTDARSTLEDIHRRLQPNEVRGWALEQLNEMFRGGRAPTPPPWRTAPTRAPPPR